MTRSVMVLVRVVTGAGLDPEPLEAGAPGDEPVEPECEVLVRVVTGAGLDPDPLEAGAPGDEPVEPECELLVRERRSAPIRLRRARLRMNHWRRCTSRSSGSSPRRWPTRTWGRFVPMAACEPLAAVRAAGSRAAGPEPARRRGAAPEPTGCPWMMGVAMAGDVNRAMDHLGTDLRRLAGGERGHRRVVSAAARSRPSRRRALRASKPAMRPYVLRIVRTPPVVGRRPLCPERVSPEPSPGKALAKESAFLPSASRLLTGAAHAELHEKPQTPGTCRGRDRDRRRRSGRAAMQRGASARRI